jgi:hypothetical protein
MEQYSIALALQDFVPVALSSIGLFYLAQMIATAESKSRWPALLGAWLAMLGGGTKAAWKLNVATTGANIVWMDNALFILLTPGFIFLAYTLWRAQRAMQGKPAPMSPWVMPLAASLTALGIAALVATVSPSTRTWNFILLGATTVANFATSMLAAWQAFKQEQKVVAGLFILNIVMIVLLQGLARSGVRTESMQWVEQILNSISNLAFAIAGYRLSRGTQKNMASLYPKLAKMN